MQYRKLPVQKFQKYKNWFCRKYIYKILKFYINKLCDNFFIIIL